MNPLGKEMSETEEAFFEKLRATFRVEAEEHLKMLSNGLFALEKAKDTTSLAFKQQVEAIFREAHSLKGAARSVNLQTIQSICQSLENVLAAWREGRLQGSSELFDTLHSTLDHIQKALENSDYAISSCIEKLENIINNVSKNEGVKGKKDVLIKPEEVADDGMDDKAVAIATSEGDTQSLSPSSSQEVKKEDLEVTNKVDHGKVVSVKAEQGQGADKTIRVSLSKLDKLFQEVEELLMVKLTSQQQLADLGSLLLAVQKNEKELGKLGDKASIEAFSQLVDRQKRGMKAIRDGLTTMVKASTQNVHFVSAMLDTLIDDMKKVLMQPISTLFEAIPRMVRDIARDLGKQVQVVFQGEEIEIDRRILEEIKDPLIHLIRNAIDHGIEKPQERLQKNKAALSTLQISAVQSEGNSVELIVSDDGRGIDLEKLKRSAVKQKIFSEKEVSLMTKEEAIKLMFFTGLSTSPMITELSGRGLGLGIVSDKVDKLGGHISVDFSLDKGTTFKLVLPLTLATFRGIHINVAGEDFIMPTHNVKRVVRLSGDEIKTIENRETVVVDGHCLSYVHLADLLSIDSESNNGAVQGKKGLFALIVKVSEQTMAFGTDNVLEEHEVLVKSLGKQSLCVKNIMAATIMEWGKVIPILNPSDLIRSAIKGNIGTARIRKSTLQENNERKKIILLAEDSITSRVLIQNILESSGYEVITAVDGQEALELLCKRPVDLLLTDVEMPRLDGFALTAKVKEMASLKTMPIIICTSRGSSEDRERGIALGANAYLDKSCFTQGLLLDAIEKLL